MWIVYLAVIFCGVALVAAYAAVVVPLAALAVSVAYAVAFTGAYLTGMGTVLVARPAGLPVPPRWPRRGADDEPAVLGYFYGPAVADADHAVRTAYDRCRRLWNFGGDLVSETFGMGQASVVTAPIGIGGALGLVVGSLLGMAGFALCALVHLTVVGVAFVVVRTTGAVLRAADSALLRIRHIRMVCPHCFDRVPYPAYGCPARGCTRRHRDIRPGRYGVVRRHCLCGAKLPTLLLFGTARMAAYCPHQGCSRSMEHRPGEAREIVLPLFGAAGAGKTRLLYGMAERLRSWSEKGLLNAELADGFTSGDLDLAGRFLRRGRATPKTAVQTPRSLIIRLGTGNDTRILQIFDAAGELFYWTERTQMLGYLDKARTFVLVIDPLSVSAFWEGLSAERQASLEGERSKAPSPDLAFLQTQQEMERMGVALGKCRLAVVFSRADLLEGPGAGDDVEAWARDELGLGNLIRSATHGFRKVRFFRTAAVLDTGGTVDPSVADLMRWLLAPSGVSLPGEGP
ncbi:hypothetical protein [Actinomadura sp. DC4]|uniref:TRAFAC clade GTPase domain-containing protein n=1 Tax=Actinomadura sp. DC4 TaxID=3055069 RepID=UPI0025B14D8E|nr:hypothetical protein [Actinomadura sp. DC4]MDN3353863.1 hypothetical protein [Actinomadura sp. DC4]